MKHTLVIIMAANKVVIKPRPWWKLWGRDGLTVSQDWQTRKLEGMTDRQRDYLMLAIDSVERAEVLRNLIARPGESLINIYFEGEESPAKVGEMHDTMAPEPMKVWAPKVPT